MGSKGAALSNAVSYALNLFMLALYVRLSSACKRRTWNGFSVEGFKELRPFAALAVQGRAHGSAAGASLQGLQIWRASKKKAQ
jgi:Na+-driven multidrug efflux pump